MKLPSFVILKLCLNFVHRFMKLVSVWRLQFLRGNRANKTTHIRIGKSVANYLFNLKYKAAHFTLNSTFFLNFKITNKAILPEILPDLPYFAWHLMTPRKIFEMPSNSVFDNVYNANCTPKFRTSSSTLFSFGK